ncbi:MAG: helical backbone metal receptor [Elusimicrobiaceae bacterium]|jgi:iron complex transport system substrate-binding protein
MALPGFIFLCAQAALGAGTVSLLPSDTEILYALGETPVCVTKFCPQPRDKKIPVCGDNFAPDIERIAVLKPDLVLVGGTKFSQAAARLEKLGLNVLETPEPRDIDGIFESIRAIGRKTAKSGQAETLIKNLRAKLAEIKIKDKAEKPKVYVEIDANRWTAGANSYISDLLRRAGGRNIFDDMPMDYGKVAWESVIARKPEFIIDLSFAGTDFGKLPGADLVPAIKNRRVLRIEDKDKYLRPSVNFPDAVKELGALLK